jgi:hypothetical protein
MHFLNRFAHKFVAQIVIDSSTGKPQIVIDSSTVTPIHESTTAVTSDSGAAAVSNSELQDHFVLKSFGDIFSSKRKQSLLEVRRTVKTLRSIRHPNVIRLLGVVKSAGGDM